MAHLPPEVEYVGPRNPPLLQAVSPSGDVRLTLRRYTDSTTLDNPSLLIRLDLRIQPRDLYAIPSDGHCGYHTLSVLTSSLYPDPPTATERASLRSRLLVRLQQHEHPALRAAGLACLRHPPPCLLPRAHWFRSDWLGLIADLPPLGCLARLEDSAQASSNPWYHSTSLSCSSTQLEHAWADILQIADSGRLMLFEQAHYHPVSPPPFLSLATRQCGSRLQHLLTGDLLPTPLPLPVRHTPPAEDARARRYTTTRSLPGGVTLGLSRSELSPEAQWGVFALKTIPEGARILEYGGLPRTQDWLDTPGQNLTYVWSDIDARVALARSGLSPVIIDANPAVTDSWGGRINDGFTHGANVEIRREAHSDKVYVWALETITPGTELTVHYGPDYWLEHYFSCPVHVQEEAAQCYALVAIEGKCYQTKDLRKLRTSGQAHQVRGRWHLGPRPPPSAEGTLNRPRLPRRRGCCPLPDLGPLPLAVPISPPPS